MQSTVAAFVSRRWRIPRGALRIDVRPMAGGLESTVARAALAHDGRTRLPAGLVVKALPPGGAREADVYEALWRHLDRPPAVRLLGRRAARGATYLFLEEAAPAVRWPWADTARSIAVCRALARLHEASALPRDPFDWDYEERLSSSAAETLAMARSAREGGGPRLWRRCGDLTRVVTALPAIRARLRAGPTAILHGDVHPGNVFLRETPSGPEVLLIDWARARVGSPYEDLASWLHSLGCWEPQARRRHDTLLRAYLNARSDAPQLADVRLDYWLASASNGLAGAIRYHLSVRADPSAPPSARDHAPRALRAWERVVRRAAALIRVNTSLTRCS